MWAKSFTTVGKLHVTQMTVNPDEIFPPLEVRTCDLNEIFPASHFKQTARYTRRTSSANWTHDELRYEEVAATNEALKIQPLSK